MDSPFMWCWIDVFLTFFICAWCASKRQVLCNTTWGSYCQATYYGQCPISCTADERLGEVQLILVVDRIKRIELSCENFHGGTSVLKFFKGGWSGS